MGIAQIAIDPPPPLTNGQIWEKKSAPNHPDKPLNPRANMGVPNYPSKPLHPPPLRGNAHLETTHFKKGLPLVMRTNINIFSCGAVCVVFFYKNFRIFDASDPGAPSLPSVAQPLHLPRALRLLAQVGFSNGHDDSDLM